MKITLKEQSFRKHVKCPHCQRKLCMTGTYVVEDVERDLIEIKHKGMLLYTTVTVIRCTNCGEFHPVTPNGIDV